MGDALNVCCQAQGFSQQQQKTNKCKANFYFTYNYNKQKLFGLSEICYIFQHVTMDSPSRVSTSLAGVKEADVVEYLR